DHALRELEKLGEVAAPALHKALAGTVTLEARRRLEMLVAKLEGAKLPPDILRQVRSVEVLASIGTPAAQGGLEGLRAAGGPAARLTREADAALRRLKRP